MVLPRAPSGAVCAGGARKRASQHQRCRIANHYARRFRAPHPQQRRRIWRRFSLGQHQRHVAQAVHVRARAAAAVAKPEDVRLVCVHDCARNAPPAARLAARLIGRRLKPQLPPVSGVLQRQRRGVQPDARVGRAAVQRVSQDGHAQRRCVHANLVRAPRHGPRLQHRGGAAVVRQLAKERDCLARAVSRGRAARVALPLPRQPAADAQPAVRRVAHGQRAAGGRSRQRAGAAALAGAARRVQAVRLRHGALLKLRRQRLVGGGREAKHQHAGRLLVQAVDDAERRPPRLTRAQPIIHAFARVRRGRVRVPACWFVHHQQVLVLVQHARRHRATAQRRGGAAGRGAARARARARRLQSRCCAGRRCPAVRGGRRRRRRQLHGARRATCRTRTAGRCCSAGWCGMRRRAAPGGC
jgi:hypothetical protein